MPSRLRRRVLPSVGSVVAFAVRHGVNFLLLCDELLFGWQSSKSEPGSLDVLVAKLVVGINSCVGVASVPNCEVWFASLSKPQPGICNSECRNQRAAPTVSTIARLVGY